MTRQEVTELAKKFEKKLKKIKVVAFDIDGILTDGSVFWNGDDIGWNRLGNTSDGYMMKVLQKAGLKVGVISGGDSISVDKRYRENLGLDFVFKGNEDKLVALNEILSWGYDESEVLFMGDEFFDLPVLQRVGFSATVPIASFEIQEQVDYVTQRESGKGCAREVMDILRVCQGIKPEVPGLLGNRSVF